MNIIRVLTAYCRIKKLIERYETERQIAIKTRMDVKDTLDPARYAHWWCIEKGINEKINLLKSLL